MPLPNPTFVAIRKKEMMAASSWRSTTPEPAKEESHFLRLAMGNGVTRESASKVVERVVYGGAENVSAFVVAPGLTILPTRKKGQEPGISPSMGPTGDVTTPQGGAAAADDDEMEDMALPDAAAGSSPSTTTAASSSSGGIPHTSAMLVFHFKRGAEADDSKKALIAAFPALGQPGNCYQTISENEQLLPTLCVKGLPFNLAPETFLTQLQQLTYQPKHLRLQRGDRGMFKCVVFIKYGCSHEADVAKIELERFHHTVRALKVEYKKRARRYIASGGDTFTTSQSQLTDLVNELKVSKENEAFTFAKGVLSKDEQKFLRGLCSSHDMLFEAPDSVTVRRKQLPLPEKSPVVRPQATTPPWQPATPGTAPHTSPGGGLISGGLNFRGIRSWKETRAQSSFKLGQGLGIVRPQGPGDVPGFAAGRGRPVQ